jgi:hypothetical protein
MSGFNRIISIAPILAKPHGQQRSRFAAFGVCVFALAHREPIHFGSMPLHQSDHITALEEDRSVLN